MAVVAALQGTWCHTSASFALGARSELAEPSTGTVSTTHWSLDTSDDTAGAALPSGLPARDEGVVAPLLRRLPLLRRRLRPEGDAAGLPLPLRLLLRRRLRLRASGEEAPRLLRLLLREAALPRRPDIGDCAAGVVAGEEVLVSGPQ